MSLQACVLCGDVVYPDEESAGWGDITGGPDAHGWCLLLKIAIDLCRQAMTVRKAAGLPTPSSPLFKDPHKPDN